MATATSNQSSSNKFVAFMVLLAGAAGIVVLVAACVASITTQDASNIALERAVTIRSNDTLTSVLDLPHRKRMHPEFVGNSTSMQTLKKPSKSSNATILQKPKFNYTRNTNYTPS